MAFSLHGIHVPHRKHTQDQPAVYMDPPRTVTIPMSMHIGAPARPIVKVGDAVRIGTKIAEASGAVSVPMHASISGCVKKITEIPLSNGGKTQAIIIESDGEMTLDDSLIPPTVNSREDLIRAILESGVVGLGGAGFPTHIKFNVDPSRIETMVINGAECEPYITSDTYTMNTKGEEIATALRALSAHLEIKDVVIGIESNKKSAIASMKRLAEELSCESCSVRVKVLPSVYPQGGEKVLIYHTVGRVVPVGKLPIDVGCIVVNCTTLAAIGGYLSTGKPLVNKCVTVDGGAVREPKNVIVPLGTSFSDVIAFCGGLSEEPAKLLYGGPMMGISVPDPDVPVLKNTNAILALTKKETRLPTQTACIRCGTCSSSCPFGLAPADIARAYEKKDAEKLRALSVNACMECGCCSFGCPAARPLVQTNKLAKAFLREEAAKEEKKA
ncbi:MAG: electron transport complex subunit RsxC [Clostridia bacterium]|nr:electron transport complex subunit RsxC [Clostridia bacterium]MBR7097949.1 electron transport complex subunit RsxC [Clostridia bacterium]